jgi:hypothetical protein
MKKLFRLHETIVDIPCIDSFNKNNHGKHTEMAGTTRPTFHAAQVG